MKVSVVLALRDRQEIVALDLPSGSTVEDAVRASGLAERFPAHVRGARLGIWSRPARASTKLRELDRVEIYRPLSADPKDQRRRRARLKPSPGSRNGP